jgi:hypothetical protein
MSKNILIEHCRKVRPIKNIHHYIFSVLKIGSLYLLRPSIYELIFGLH